MSEKEAWHLPEVGGVVDLLTAEQLPHEVDDVWFEVALIEHCVQHAGTERPTSGKLGLEQVGEVVRPVGLGEGGGNGFSFNM